MNKENCNVVRDLMPLVIDDVASAESRELVNEHLKDCAECQGIMETMRAAVHEGKISEKDEKFVKLCLKLRSKLSWRRLVAGTVLLAMLVGMLIGGEMLISFEVNRDARPYMPRKCTVAADENGYLVLEYTSDGGHKDCGYTAFWDDWNGIYYITPQAAAWPSSFKKEETVIRYGNRDLRLVDGNFKLLFGYYSAIVADNRARQYAYEDDDPILCDVVELRVGTLEDYVTIYRAGDEVTQLETSVVRTGSVNDRYERGKD